MSTSGAAPAGGPPSGAAGGDLGGVYPAPSVVGLQGRGVSATAPTDTQGLIWNNGLGLWVPTSIAVPVASNLVTGPDAFGASPVVGTGSTFSRGDHNHGLPANPTPAFAAPTIALGTAAAAGAAGTIIRSDATIVAFDATVPVVQAFGDAAGIGVAVVASRRDHKHGMPAQPVTTFNGASGAVAQANGYGVAGADASPPIPAVALATSSGQSGAGNVTILTTATDIMSTANLAVGKWFLFAESQIQAGTATSGNYCFLLFAVGTATATFAPVAGAVSVQSWPTVTAGTYYNQITAIAIVTVTAAGTIKIQAGASTNAGFNPSTTGQGTAYSALRVA